jgi:hypothetical protein
MSKSTASAAGGATPAEGHRTRRAMFGLFASAPVLAMLPTVTMANDGVAATPEDRLGSLFADLCRVHAERSVAAGVDDDEAYEKLHNRHWELREAIDATVATTLAGFRVKAMTAELAFESDKEAECEGAGSFIGLCQSLHRDLLAAN